jgi:hypothetical protein
LTLEGRGMKMEGLNFDSLLDRPVNRRDGIEGVLRFPVEVLAHGNRAQDIRCLEAQLGLQLAAAKGSVFLVIDRVERPSENQGAGSFY